MPGCFVAPASTGNGLALRLTGEAIPPQTSQQTHMLYMVIETFRGGDPVPVYRRFRDQGRLMRGGIEYRGSWVTDDLRRCFQVMECEDRRLLDEWIANWSDLTAFEVIPVITSADAAARIAPRL